MVTKAQTKRQQQIVDVLDDAFADLMKADPHAFRVKFRKMAADPFAFYRGSACLFYADMTAAKDAWADDRTSRVWIHGDLHAENFGTYMNSHGRMVFDVNDFDEAYIGHFSWDLRRFVASLALMGWQKALPDEAVRNLVGRYLRSYLAQVTHYSEIEEDDDFALHLENTDGPVQTVLRTARTASRVAPARRHDPLRGRRARVLHRRDGPAPRQGRAPQGGEGVRVLPGDDPAVEEVRPRPVLRRARHRREVRLRDRQRRACPPTTCSSRATASRSTTTWCCR